MIRVASRVFGEDGMIRMNIVADEPFKPLDYVPLPCHAWVQGEAVPSPLGMMTCALEWPALGPQVVNGREYLFIHYRYGTRVSDCIRLGIEGWQVLRKTMPSYAFVAVMPKNAVEGQVVLGVELFTAEWMARNCVAIG